MKLTTSFLRVSKPSATTFQRHPGVRPTLGCPDAMLRVKKVVPQYHRGGAGELGPKIWAMFNWSPENKKES